jgi:hypothetical protein
MPVTTGIIVASVSANVAAQQRCATGISLSVYTQQAIAGKDGAKAAAVQNSNTLQLCCQYLCDQVVARGCCLLDGQGQ